MNSIDLRITKPYKYYFIAACVVLTNWIHGEEVWAAGEMVEFRGIDFGQIAAVLFFGFTVIIAVKNRGIFGSKIRSNNIFLNPRELEKLKYPILAMSLVFFNWRTMWSYVDSNGYTIIERSGFGGLYSFQLFIAGVILMVVVFQNDNLHRRNEMISN